MSDNRTSPPPPDITTPYDQFQIYGLIAWIEANGYKPHVLVDTRYPGVQAPPTSMAKPQEIFNLHSQACVKFRWQDDRVEFYARFGGRDYALKIPYKAILAINFAGTSMWIPMPWTMFNDDGTEKDTPAPQAEVSAEPLPPPPPEVKVDETIRSEGTVRVVDFSKNRPKK